MNDMPHHIETRNQMGIKHPYPNGLDTIQPVNVPLTDNGYSPLSSPNFSHLEDTGTSKTS